MDSEVVTFEYESARCTVLMKNGRGFVSHVYAKTRSQGHGTGLLKLVIEFADKNGLELYLYARGYGGPVQTMLNSEQLIRFYENFGFVNHGRVSSGEYMIREKNTPYSEREN